MIESRAMLPDRTPGGPLAMVAGWLRTVATAENACLTPRLASACAPRWNPPSTSPHGNVLGFDAGGPRWPREPAEPVRQPAAPEAVFWGWAATVLVIAALLLPFSLTALIDLWRYLAR